MLHKCFHFKFNLCQQACNNSDEGNEEGEDKKHKEIDTKDNQQLLSKIKKLNEEIQKQQLVIDVYERNIYDISNNNFYIIDFSSIKTQILNFLKSSISEYEALLNSSEEEIPKNPQKVKSNDDKIFQYKQNLIKDTIVKLKITEKEINEFDEQEELVSDFYEELEKLEEELKKDFQEDLTKRYKA